MDERRASFITFASPTDCTTVPISNRTAKKTRVSFPIKRKQEHKSLTETTNTSATSILIQYCRAGNWNQALERVVSNPEEAIPVCATVGQFPTKRTCNDELNYEATALMIVCSARSVKKEDWNRLIQALIQASPLQIKTRCLEYPSRYTPLQALVEHPFCSPEILQLFLDQEEGILEAYHSFDLSGSTIGTLCMYLSKGWHTEKIKDLIKVFIDSFAKSDNQHKPPAIAAMLLSLGKDENLNQVIEMVQYSIAKDKSALYQKSSLTACNLLHLALRNFGDSLELIQYLIQADKEGTLLSETNIYGDMPLHVACTCGISMPIWNIILSMTPRSLLWKTNNAGYTCIDLEWMRHMELGRNMSESRIYLPLPAQAFPREPRLENACRDLLQEAVMQVIESDDSCKLGTVLHRIMELVQHAGGCQNSTMHILHAASTLTRLPGPCLAAPLMQLFHFLHPNQVSTADKKGRYPLHHALMSVGTYDLFHSRLYDASDHQLWVEQLVHLFPEATKFTDSHHRLPLHYALENNAQLVDKAAAGVLSSNVMLLVKVFPDSIHSRVPSSCLYPFQHAATNTNFGVETIFTLLLRDPSVIHQPS